MSSAPTSDDSSSTTPLPDDLLLWRRVHREKVVLAPVADGATERRPSSDCFTDNLRDGSSMSVFDSQQCGGAEVVLNGHPDYGIVAVSVGQFKTEGLTVVRTAEGGLGHCEVIGAKTHGVRRRLAKLAQWIVGPPERPS